jgi:starvation-inducible DNA-binding protein
MLSTTIADLTALVEGLEETAKIAEEAKDDATADVIIGQVEQLQKQIWMLKSTLG